MEIIIKTHGQRIVLLCVQCEGLPMKFKLSKITIIIVFALISASCLFGKPSET